jgi:hypothetical protein
MTGAGLGQITGERGDHQHGFEPLAEQDDGGLNECGRHERTCVWFVLSLLRIE